MPEPAPAHTAAIAIGSNLPSRFGTLRDNLEEAIRRLQSLGEVAAVSTFLTTDPVGYLNQPRFLNGALLLRTDRAPLDLLHALLGIERGMGRTRDGVPAKGPRIIDLDLIFYGDLILDTPELTLPHPALAERTFVLAPLAELAPNWCHPITHLTVTTMLANLEQEQTREER